MSVQRIEGIGSLESLRCCEIHLYKLPQGIPRVLLVLWRICFLQQCTFCVVLQPSVTGLYWLVLVWDVLWFHSYMRCF